MKRLCPPLRPSHYEKESDYVANPQICIAFIFKKIASLLKSAFLLFIIAVCFINLLKRKVTM